MAPAWLRALFVRNAVSESWLASHAADALKVGVELPRWRTPKERTQMQRQDRRQALRVVSRREAK